MSFLGRGLIIVAVAAGVAHVFRKDIARLAALLRKPAANFLGDVRRELQETAPPPTAPAAVAAAPPAVAAVPPPPPAAATPTTAPPAAAPPSEQQLR